MYTTLVTIGRNIGTLPMPELEWFTFQDEVAELLSEALSWQLSAGWEGGSLAKFSGQSFWEGVAEHSAMFQLLHEIEFEPGDYEVIRNALKELATRYRQEAIALIPAVQADLVPASQPV